MKFELARRRFQEGEDGGGSSVPLEHARQLGEAMAKLDIIQASHEALATTVTGLNEVINALGSRLDAVVEAQEKAGSAIIKIDPEKAAEAEVEGAKEVVEGEEGTEPLTGVESGGSKSDSPVSKFHKMFG